MVDEVLEIDRAAREAKKKQDAADMLKKRAEIQKRREEQQQHEGQPELQGQPQQQGGAPAGPPYHIDFPSLPQEIMQQIIQWQQGQQGQHGQQAQEVQQIQEETL